MRRFSINVNGQAYDVQVEELDGAAPAISPVPAAAPAPVAAAVAPAPATAPAQPAPVQPVPAGGTKMESPMPGVILDIKVSVGDTVKSGQPVVILEAMKMENDIVAPVDGTVTSILVNKGDAVDSNQVIATID